LPLYSASVQNPIPQGIRRARSTRTSDPISSSLSHRFTRCRRVLFCSLFTLFLLLLATLTFLLVSFLLQGELHLKHIG
jgi:hypothetical protein